MKKRMSRSEFEGLAPMERMTIALSGVKLFDERWTASKQKTWNALVREWKKQGTWNDVKSTFELDF